MKAISYYFEDVVFSKKVLPPKNSIMSFLKNKKATIHVVCFVFCSDKYLQVLNKKHLSHTDLTDVITFNYSEKNNISGDIIISYERVKENALTYNVSLKEELSRVMIHGVLHLMGYNDKSIAETKKMRKMENLYIKHLT